MRKLKNMRLRNLLIVFTFLAIHSCTLWGPAEWQNLKDRNFIFSRFTYTHLNAGKNRALAAMRLFNLEPVLKSLEKKHGISIDARAFLAFLERANAGEISEQGILMTNSYIWDIKEAPANRAEVELKVNYGDDMRIMNYSYQVTLKVNGKVRAIYFDNVTEENKIIERILSHIGAGLNEKDFPRKDFSKSEKNNFNAKISNRLYETEGRIKDMIDEYINALSPENKKRFREELIQHLREQDK